MSAKDQLDDIKDAGILESVPVDESTVPIPESLRELSDAELRAMEKRIVRKADLVLMPILGILYILNYIDRQNLAAAKLQGIMEDLNMTTTDFATAISILFVGYLPFQLLSNLLVASISRPGLYICCCCIIWGIISACTAAVHTFPQLLGVRVILGAVEASFFPGAIYLLSAWYTKNDLGKRIGGLYFAQQIGNAFGGLIAAGCLTLDGRYGIRGWRWLFIVEGACTVGIGIICACFIPEYPYNAKRLYTQQERDLAVWRLEKEAGAGEGSEDVGTWQGFKIGLRDPKIYALIFCNMMSQFQGSIANFFPTIVKTLGYNNLITLLLTAPPYIWAAGWYMGLTWWSDKRNTIYPLIVGSIFLSFITYILPMATENVGARYFGMIFMPCLSVGPQLMLYKTINHHLPRPVAKRAAAVAMLNSIGGTANIPASYLWFAPPRYYAAFSTLIGCGLLFAITITGYRWHVRNENRKLDEGGDRAKETMRWGVTQQQIDMGWRYEGY